MENNKKKCGAKIKPLRDKKYLVQLMLQGSTIESFGDKLKPKLGQKEISNTINGLYKLIEEK